ncbi:MAG: Respiratory nitrate reductase 2 beta chain [bacterium ADurb.Bin429]|nr:MAG: Respiratory nitrate reductase 2 beta chain [bacterium ADurb.Bin429]
MNVRAQTASVFHLDKCIGCHTCSIACKNIWTDRPGAEYMWWNNVETKPGTGYPTTWEDQEHYRGGWEVDRQGRLRLRSLSKHNALFKLFYHPQQPELDDYYEPWTYRYEQLFNAPSSDDQPTAVPVSQITGEILNIEAGPNWDDDLSGSPLYAANDPNLRALTAEEREQLFAIERVVMMYLPRICNHCANPACVAACPSGALYKRGEDGIVLVNQDVCRGWRACIAACPYKKIYYNWQSGKSEKCILCYPRLETGQPTACFHSCVGRIRYMGVLLYDADRIEAAMTAPDAHLVEAARGVLCDPFDPDIQASARRNGVSDECIAIAQRSPVWRYVMEWKLALPLHIEYRTMPMLFYVPPLLPAMGTRGAGGYARAGDGVFTDLEHARLPIKYLASLFSADNVDHVTAALKKLLAVRLYKRAQDLHDLDDAQVRTMMWEAGLTPDDAEAIYALTAIPTVADRYVLPPIQREEAMSGTCDPELCKGTTGFGVLSALKRGS